MIGIDPAARALRHCGGDEEADGHDAARFPLKQLLSVFLQFNVNGGNKVAAGFGGISLGSTATAVANMTAVAQRYGAAHRAFVVVPLVCGFFIDIANALVVGALVAL